MLGMMSTFAHVAKLFITRKPHVSSKFISYILAPSDNDDDRWYEADAARRWMSFAGARSGWPLGCPPSVLARHWRSSGATNASSLGRSIELRLVFRGGEGHIKEGQLSSSENC